MKTQSEWEMKYIIVPLFYRREEGWEAPDQRWKEVGAYFFLFSSEPSDIRTLQPMAKNGAN